MLKYNFAARFLFSGIGFCIVLVLPVLMGLEIASQYYTMMMALNLFSGWFSLSFRQQLYVDIKMSDQGGNPKPTWQEKVVTKGRSLALLAASAFAAPYVVPDITGMQVPFFIGIVAAYLISVSYVFFWYSGKLYLSYAIESSTTIIVFLTIVILDEPNFVAGFIAVFILAAAVFRRVGLRRWLEIPSGPNTASSQILSQLIAVASFAEVVFFAGIELDSDIVTYRITLSFLTVLAIFFGVFRQWQIFQNSVTHQRWRSWSIFVAAIMVMPAGCLAFVLFPPALFVLLLVATLAQLVAAADQFLVIQGSRSSMLLVGYAIALSLVFGGAYLLKVTDLYALLLFKIVLICATSLVPTSLVLFFKIWDK